MKGNDKVMIKANEFNKLVDTIKQKELEKNKRIQADMKITEDALNDLYIKIEKNRNLGMTIPKYTTIPKVLEKEVIDELILNQGYFVDLDKQGHTRIYYNKEDFDNRTAIKKDEPITSAKENDRTINKLQYNESDLTKKEDNKFSKRATYNIEPTIEVDENSINLSDLLRKISQLHSCERGWC